jgi:hypothetical protein
MRSKVVPFAVELYRRHLGGQTVEQLSCELGIPLDRVAARIRAAEAYLRCVPADADRDAGVADPEVCAP